VGPNQIVRIPKSWLRRCGC